MKYLRLGKTELKVSPVCLGTGQFGTGISRELAFWQLDAFTDLGGNFIDSARVYGDWALGQNGLNEKGLSEKTIGQWLRQSGKRDRIVIMTKGGHPLLETMNISRCTPSEIKTDIKESLACLCVDYIDLYLLHRDNPALPVEPILEVLENARLEGKIKHYGFSNWTLPRMLEAAACAELNGMEGFSCNQAMWSLAEINRENIADKTMVPMDADMYRWHCRSGVSVTAYNSTAHGWFAKLEKGQTVSDKQKLLYGNEKTAKIHALIKKASAESGLSALAVSLGYMTSHPFPSVPITSFSKKEQLTETLGVCGTVLPSWLASEINALKGLA